MKGEIVRAPSQTFLFAYFHHYPTVTLQTLSKTHRHKSLVFKPEVSEIIPQKATRYGRAQTLTFIF